jgi:hypothetical protein
LRKPGSRFARARMVSLKCRVEAMGVPFGYSSSGVFTRTFQVSKISAPAFQGAITNKRVIGGGTDDRLRGSPLESGNIFLLAQRDQSEPFADLLYNADSLRPGDAGTKGQARERSVDFSEGARRAEIVFTRFTEQFCAGCVI